MRLLTPGIADPTQFDPNSPYYDPKFNPKSPRCYTAVVEFVDAFPSILPLTTLKHEFGEQELAVTRRGNQLSVMPVSEAVAERILLMTRSCNG